MDSACDVVLNLVCTCLSCWSTRTTKPYWVADTQRAGTVSIWLRSVLLQFAHWSFQLLGVRSFCRGHLKEQLHLYAQQVSEQTKTNMPGFLMHRRCTEGQYRNDCIAALVISSLEPHVCLLKSIPAVRLILKTLHVAKYHIPCDLWC